MTKGRVIMSKFQPGQRGQSQEVFTGVCRMGRPGPGKKVEIGVTQGSPAHEGYKLMQAEQQKAALGTGTGTAASAIGDHMEKEARKPDTQNCGPDAIPTGIIYKP